MDIEDATREVAATAHRDSALPGGWGTYLGDEGQSHTGLLGAYIYGPAIVEKSLVWELKYDKGKYDDAFSMKDLLEDAEKADEMIASVSAAHLARLEGLKTKAAEERISFFETFTVALKVQHWHTLSFVIGTPQDYC